MDGDLVAVYRLVPERFDSRATAHRHARQTDELRQVSTFARLQALGASEQDAAAAMDNAKSIVRGCDASICDQRRRQEVAALARSAGEREWQ